ncbi:unnamed protein product [Sympodiomycopsis kandeliae]
MTPSSEHSDSAHSAVEASQPVESDCVRIVTFDKDHQNKEVKFFLDIDVLRNASDFFKLALSGEWSETQTQSEAQETSDEGDAPQTKAKLPMPTIKFPEDRPEIVQSVLWFIEGAEVPPSEGTVLELCRFADKVGIQKLISCSDTRLAKEAITSEDPLEYLNFAEAQKLPQTYRSSSISFLRKPASHISNFGHFVSPQTRGKFTIHRRIFHIAVALRVCFCVAYRIERLVEGNCGNSEMEQDSLATFLSLALLADVGKVKEMHAALSCSKPEPEGSNAIKWLSANDGIDLDSVPPTPAWATNSTIESVRGRVVKTMHPGRPWIGKLLTMVTQIFDNLKSLDE